MPKRGGTVDMTGIAQAISKMPQFRRTAKLEVEKRLVLEKQVLIDEFDSHKVTHEVQDGPTASNISNTLGGPGSSANLYTFIGFSEGFNPVRPIKTILYTSIHTSSVAMATAKRGPSHVPVASVNVTLPNENKIREASLMPWEPGKSWISGIEEGISGFGYYMYKKFEKGRSGYALQSKHKVRNAHFRPVPYLKEMLGRFTSRLRRL